MLVATLNMKEAVYNHININNMLKKENTFRSRNFLDPSPPTPHLM